MYKKVRKKLKNKVLNLKKNKILKFKKPEKIQKLFSKRKKK